MRDNTYAVMQYNMKDGSLTSIVEGVSHEDAKKLLDVLFEVLEQPTKEFYIIWEE